MNNPSPASLTLTGRDVPRPTTLGSPDTDHRFAPVCIRPVELAITTVADELGRPLVGVFVPDAELL